MCGTAQCASGDYVTCVGQRSVQVVIMSHVWDSAVCKWSLCHMCGTAQCASGDYVTCVVQRSVQVASGHAAYAVCTLKSEYNFGNNLFYCLIESSSMTLRCSSAVVRWCRRAAAGRSPAEILGSNPTGGMDIILYCTVFYRIAPYCITLYYVTLNYIMLY